MGWNGRSSGHTVERCHTVERWCALEAGVTREFREAMLHALSLKDAVCRRGAEELQGRASLLTEPTLLDICSKLGPELDLLGLEDNEGASRS